MFIHAPAPRTRARCKKLDSYDLDVIVQVRKLGDGRDPMALLIVIPIVLAVTFLAAYHPARRASRVNPVQALRYE